jgi:hypothetical protein
VVTGIFLNRAVFPNEKFLSYRVAGRANSTTNTATANEYNGNILPKDCTARSFQPSSSASRFFQERTCRSKAYTRTSLNPEYVRIFPKSASRKGTAHSRTRTAPFLTDTLVKCALQNLQNLIKSSNYMQICGEKYLH